MLEIVGQRLTVTKCTLLPPAYVVRRDVMFSLVHHDGGWGPIFQLMRVPTLALVGGGYPHPRLVATLATVGTPVARVGTPPPR